MENKQLLQRLFKYVPLTTRKKPRPRLTWLQGIYKAMTSRVLKPKNLKYDMQDTVKMQELSLIHI